MKYVKKPIPVDAVQITSPFVITDMPLWFITAYTRGDVYFDNTGSAQNGLTIKTLEGKMFAPWGYVIVKGVDGELYPVRGDIFQKTYEEYKG